MLPELQQYLNSLRANLRLDPHSEHQILCEIYTHLEERIQELRESGLTQEEAVKKATERFGRPRTLAREIYEAHIGGSWLDAFMAGSPHLVVALLFATQAWSNLWWLSLSIVSFIIATLHGWWRGKPAWFYPWLGYSLLMPLAACLSSLFLIARMVSGVVFGGTPSLGPWVWVAIFVYVPFSLWLLSYAVKRVVRRDWLYVSLMSLPLPVIVTWLITLQSSGRLFSQNSFGAHEADLATASMFLFLALAVAIFIRLTQRALRIGVLLFVIPILLIMLSPRLEGGPDFWGISALALLSIALLLSPILLELAIGRGDNDANSWSESWLEQVPRRG
ncbi:MAG: hypothetical protein HYX82_04820 [Chloroflexi bacterium]|nr:hypothetical protein [Chloroflexota bacterium]